MAQVWCLSWRETWAILWPVSHPQSIIEAFRAAGQEQVFAFWDSLSSEQQQNLLAQAQEIDLAEIARLNATLVAQSEGEKGDFSGLIPAPFEPLPQNGGDQNAWNRAREIGENALRAGRVAAFTVAGGQGTRLGYDGPKGTFPVTPLTQKSLFQVFAEKIDATQKRFGAPLHWFIMTSHINHDATEHFFREHDFFGLDSTRVHFFRQGRMPAVDFAGKILLEAPDQIAMSPDGHGGSLRALARSGALELMKNEGVDTISYFQVDNPLVRCVDPEFIGWHLQKQSEMSSKMLPKAYPEEKLGHFCLENGRLVVVEYSDLPMEMQRQRDENGRLRFVAGSIALHVLDRDFVARMAQESSLPFHRADKKIPFVNASGEVVKPEAPNGIKFETFVFDALPFAQNPLVIETSRAEEFAPVKNAQGADSPQTVIEDQLRQWTRWANAAGANIATDETGLPPFSFEVAPSFALDETSFAQSWEKLGSAAKIEAGTVLK